MTQILQLAMLAAYNSLLLTGLKLFYEIKSLVAIMGFWQIFIKHTKS